MGRSDTLDPFKKAEPGYSCREPDGDILQFNRNIPDISNLQVEDLNSEDPLIFCSVDADFSLHIVVDLNYADSLNIRINTKKNVRIDSRLRLSY
jgi:hypothetical protein